MLTRAGIRAVLDRPAWDEKVELLRGMPSCPAQPWQSSSALPEGRWTRRSRRNTCNTYQFRHPDKVLVNLPDVLLYESLNKVRLARQFGYAGRAMAKRSRTRSPVPRRVTKTREQP